MQTLSLLQSTSKISFMKFNGKIFYYIISTTLIVVIASILYNFKSKSELKYTQLNDEYNHVKSILSNHLMSANSNDGFKFNQNILVEDEYFNKVKLSNLISNENILVYRISEMHCSTCDESGLNSLSKITSKIPNKDIIIVSSFYNTQLMNSYKAEHNLNHKIYNLKQSINLKAEELNFPYFLVLTKDLEVLSCFFPEKSMPEFTDQYFYGIQHLFNDKE